MDHVYLEGCRSFKHGLVTVSVDVSLVDSSSDC